MGFNLEIIPYSPHLPSEAANNYKDVIDMFDQVLMDHPSSASISFFKNYSECVTVLQIQQALEHYLTIKEKNINQIKEKLTDIASKHFSDTANTKMQSVITQLILLDYHKKTLIPPLVELAQNLQHYRTEKSILEERITQQENLQAEIKEKIKKCAQIGLIATGSFVAGTLLNIPIPARTGMSALLSCGYYAFQQKKNENF